MSVLRISFKTNGNDGDNNKNEHFSNNEDSIIMDISITSNNNKLFF